MRAFLSLVVLIALTACDSTSSPSEVVVGEYAASVFVTIAPGDGGVDQLASGGNLRVTFAADGTYSGEMIVSNVDRPGTPPFRSDLSGRYEVFGEALRVTPEDSPSPFFGGTEAIIEDDGDRLVTPDYPPRGAPFKIVLVRV